MVVDSVMNFHWAVDMRFMFKCEDRDKCQKLIDKFYKVADKLGVACLDPEVDGDYIAIICPEEINCDVTEDVFLKSFLNKWWKKYEKLLKVLEEGL